MDSATTIRSFSIATEHRDVEPHGLIIRIQNDYSALQRGGLAQISPLKPLLWNASMAKAQWEAKLTTKAAAAMKVHPCFLKLHHHILLKEDKESQECRPRE